jgi:hypothetical protein
MKSFVKDFDLGDIGKVTLEQRIVTCLDAQFWPWIRTIKTDKTAKGQDVITS